MPTDKSVRIIDITTLLKETVAFALVINEVPGSAAKMVGYTLLDQGLRFLVREKADPGAVRQLVNALLESGGSPDLQDSPTYKDLVAKITGGRWDTHTHTQLVFEDLEPEKEPAAEAKTGT